MANQNRHPFTDQTENEIEFQLVDDNPEDNNRYPYGTRINPNGEIEYRIPMEFIPEDEDALSDEERQLTHYGEISFFDGARHTFRFFWSTDRKLAFDQRTYLNDKHTADRRFGIRNHYFEGDSNDGEEGQINRDENPLLATNAHSYLEVVVNDLKQRMVAYTYGKFPKQPYYGKVLEMSMIQKMDREKIAKKLDVSYPMATYYLRKAEEAAAEYYQLYVPKGTY